MKQFFLQKFGLYVRNVETGNLLETFFVVAISSILIVRAYLDWANYPTIGGSHFHIAHMLWGGLFMLVAIFMLLTFLNRQAKQVAAVVGGVGFGMFIDELGKFITRDNNYFYQPTVALIYVVFLLLFFAINSLQKHLPISEAGYTVNAIEILKEFVLKDMPESERQHALSLLKHSSQNDPVASRLVKMLEEFQPKEMGRPNVFVRFSRWLKQAYIKVTHTRWFSQGTVWFFAVFALVGCIEAVRDIIQSQTYSELGELISSLVAFGFVVAGTRLLQKGQRLKAYRSFKHSVVVSILFTQFFLFIEEQFRALIALVISLIVYGAVQYLVSQEEKYESESQNLFAPKMERYKA